VGDIFLKAHNKKSSSNIGFDYIKINYNSFFSLTKINVMTLQKRSFCKALTNPNKNKHKDSCAEFVLKAFASRNISPLQADFY
jgi:hypothetical protein